VTSAQWLYVVVLCIYGILFLVFLRIFAWRRYAQKNFYEKRPHDLSPERIAQIAAENGVDIPRFSLFVPARNEADVIEKTVDHLSRLRYSPDHYEVIVVTDEKEVQAAAEERAQLIADLRSFLTGNSAWNGSDRHDSVLFALLAHLSLEEGKAAERIQGAPLSIKELLKLPAAPRQEALQEIALALASGKRKSERERLLGIIRRCFPALPESEINNLYPLFLSLAIPAVIAAAELKDEKWEGVSEQMMAQAAEARQPLTKKVLISLGELIATQIVQRLSDASDETLAAWLQDACVWALPTTQEIVERKRLQFAGDRNRPAIRHVIVPWDFDGYVDGVCTGHFVPSTKGRALNYAFRFADERAEVWGFYDAESRPDPDVLLYVAWRRLTVGDQFQIAQGPVFQIRNFWKTSFLCKVAGLYQAVSHEWQMPNLLRSIPFIGGTNIFATRKLMLKIGGFDDTVLTEDMDLGARAWLQGDAWPEFLPYASSEQTPPTFKAFYRQRLRWGAGYLQVYDKLKADKSLPQNRTSKLLRTYWWKGHFSWTLFQLIAFLPFIIFGLKLAGLIDPSGIPAAVNTLIFTFGPFYLLFTLYCFFHYYPHMDPAPDRIKVRGFLELFALPISAFFLPVPYSSALTLKIMGKQPKAWVKTPRTKE
jgi:cellulose synthase/poly-beta-1,6-N-acetylglucosamine synthase-like glycosyltransferase